MTLPLQWFSVQLSIPNIPPEQAHQIISDLQEELNMRPYLRNTNVFWEQKTNQIVVMVEDEAFSSDQARRNMAEELFEIASAVRDPAGLSIKVLDIKPLDA
jgi:hypothetical protein